MQQGTSGTMDPPEKPSGANSATPKSLKLAPPNSTTSPIASTLPSPRADMRARSGASSPSVSQRSSFVEAARGIPHHSPHNQRNPSITQQALQDLINNPPIGLHDRKESTKFAGRDWRKIGVGEIVAPEETRFVQVDTSVEEATKVSTFTPHNSTHEGASTDMAAPHHVRCAQCRPYKTRDGHAHRRWRVRL